MHVVSARVGYADFVLGKILYVEDNADHAELVLRHMERRQLRERVVHVVDGEKALAHLGLVGAGRVTSPAVVLLDLRLPLLDGLAVLRHIRSTAGLASIPVVVLTTSAAEREAAARERANSYMVKPADGTSWGPLIDAVVADWLGPQPRSTM
jgi:two-component system response regulator